MSIVQHPWVICGFPGVGKTHFYEKFRVKNITLGTHMTSVDSDSMDFNKDDFPDNYITHIKKQVTLGINAILVSTHHEVLDELTNSQINHLIVYPDKSLKLEYLKRYIKRRSPFDFIKKTMDNWGDWIDEIEARDKEPYTILVKLHSGEYLADLFNIGAK